MDMDQLFTTMLPYLIPIIILELALTITALVHVLTHKNYRFGTRTLWVILCFVQIIGPIIYFVFGRSEE
jgi:heme/copper-type cytochrome/quinol oxidase subunit 4